MSRIEEWRKPDGTWSTHRVDAIHVTRADVLAAVASAGGSPLPGSFFLGTAQHESTFAINERDTEPPDIRGNRFVSWGIYQLSKDEHRRAGVPDDDDTMLSLLGATRALLFHAARYRASIRRHIGTKPDEPDPHDLPAYVALAHNQGLGVWDANGRGALGTIYRHGVDWTRYDHRNPGAPIVAYGWDVLGEQPPKLRRPK